MAFGSIGGAGKKRSSVKAELPLSEHSGKLGTEPTGVQFLLSCPGSKEIKEAEPRKY